MKKVLFFCGLLLLATFLGVVFFYKKNGISDRSVVVFVPASHPAMDEIVAGFRDSLREKIPFVEFNLYNGQGNKTLMQSQAEMIVASNCNLVFTIGNATSQLIRACIAKRGSAMPHIFTAVDDPVEKGLVSTLEKPGNRTTGVISVPQFDQQMRYLSMINPVVRSILLVYDPTHPSNAADIKTLESLLKEKQIELVLCPIHQTGEIKQKITLLLDDVDALLILKDHLLVMGVELLAYLCQQKAVPLYSSDLNSADKGAALAFGIREWDYGAEAVDAVYQILVEKRDAGLIPVKEIKTVYFKINKAALESQGIRLTEDQIYNLEQSGVIIS